MCVSQEVAGPCLCLEVTNFLGEAHKVLIVGHCLTKLPPGAVAVSQVAEGTRLPSRIFQLPSYVQVAVIMQQGHFMTPQGLVGNCKVAMS